MDASGVLLALRRNNILDQLGLNLGEDTGQKVYGTFQLFPDAPDEKQEITCGAWLLSFQRLPYLKEKIPNAAAIDTIVNNVPTRYLLTGPHGLASTEVQEALFEAAKILVNEDGETVQMICKDYPLLLRCQK